MRHYISILFFLTMLMACDIANNKVEPTATFAKIYDDSRFEQAYYPLDIIQTADNGYLILSEKNNSQALFTSVVVLKVNEMGEVQSFIDMPDPYVLPVKGWLKVDDIFYFICMDANNLSAQLVAVDESGQTADPVIISGLTYPLVANVDNSNIVVLSYDNTNAETVVSVLNTNGQISQQAGYSIGSGVDVEKPIIDHLTRNGPQLPFTVGKLSSGLFYFNGFFNYTFSLVFTNLVGAPSGVCQGQLSQGGISAIAELGTDLFAIARFNFGANYLDPMANISSTSITSSTDLGGNIFPEIESDAKVALIKAGTGNNWIYGTTTQSKRIVLFGFDKSTGNILATNYVGSGNPYSLAAMAVTNDGGLAILARTALESRFSRIALFKRNKEFLEIIAQ